MILDITKDIYVKDKEDGKIYKVSGIFLPVDKPSGKDITIDVEPDLCEWRAIDEVELMPQCIT